MTKPYFLQKLFTVFCALYEPFQLPARLEFRIFASSKKYPF